MLMLSCKGGRDDEPGRSCRRRHGCAIRTLNDDMLVDLMRRLCCRRQRRDDRLDLNDKALLVICQRFRAEIEISSPRGSWKIPRRPAGRLTRRMANRS